MKIPKLPPIKLTEMQRSRLKMTIAGMVVLSLLFSVPIIVIFRAANQNIFEINAPWIFLGTAVTAFGGIIGYYVNRETARPSLLTNTTIIQDALTPDKNDEGFTDPESIPL